MPQDINHIYPHKELNRVPADLSQFWVITVLSNPVRYKRRYELYWRFAEMCNCAGVNLVTVEQAFGNRRFMVTDRNNPNHLQVRTVEELWHKENMINLGIAHACEIAKDGVREVAWIDADCRSARTPRDWFEETWHGLQHYEFVQMWEWLINLDYHHNPIGEPNPSFMANYIKFGTPYPKGVEDNCNPYNYASRWGSPGLAWAANISAFNAIGGLPDFAILGANDWYLAHMLISNLKLSSMEKYSEGYRNMFLTRQEICNRWIRQDVGYISGLVYHDFHGKKADRQYGTRELILLENGYDPNKDIKRDAYGMYQLETWEPRQILMRDRIRAYFRARSEDSIDL